MGWRINDLQGAALPLTGQEILELEQGGNSRQVRVMDLLPGFDGSTLAAELAAVDGATKEWLSRTPDGRISLRSLNPEYSMAK